jgi:hypothetical protein
MRGKTIDAFLVWFKLNDVFLVFRDGVGLSWRGVTEIFQRLSRFRETGGAPPKLRFLRWLAS